MKKSIIAKLYRRYLVKNTALFFIIIIVAATLFLLASWHLKIDVIDTYIGNNGDRKIVINEIIDYPFQSFYVYKNKSEDVEKCLVTDIEYFDEQYTLIIPDKNIKFDGNVYVDIIKSETTLLKLILGIDDKYITKK